MPRVAVPLVGPSNTLRSLNADAERTINLYPESTDPGNGKVPVYLVATPGLRPFAEVDDAPGYQSFYQDGRAFVVVGITFAEVLSNGSVTDYGSVTEATADLPASIVSNGTAGNQLLIVSGGDGYVFDLGTNVLTQITTANFPGTAFPDGTALMCEFLDGYGIVLVAESRRFHISALEDFTSWDALDVAERSMGSDDFVGVIRNNRELWFPGTKTGEIWYDNGDALFPFAPVPGTFLESGAVSPSMTRIANTIAWLSLDERGQCQVNVADGYSPKRISTHAVERMLQSSVDPSAAKLFTQQQQGHTFLWVLIPDLETTWCYDIVMGLWHERALWDPDTAQWEPHLANSAMFAFGKTLVTDRSSGVIYELDLDAYDDSVVP